MVQITLIDLMHCVADDNHKPEMTIAVTPFDGLCGFRPLKEISHFLSTVPSLRGLIGDSASKDFENAVSGHETSESEKDVEKNKKALQAAFSALMKVDKSTIASAAKKLVASAEKEGDNFAGGGGPSNGGKELADLVIRLNGQFEGDVGLFVLFFLNYVKLEIGEAMFLKADDIHAYLSGGESLLVFSHKEEVFHHRSRVVLILILMQISSSAWHPLITSSGPASPQSSKTYPPSQPCLPIPTLLSRSKRCIPLTTLTLLLTAQRTLPHLPPSSTTLRSRSLAL